MGKPPYEKFRCPRCEWHNEEAGAFWVGTRCPRCSKDNLVSAD